MGGWTQHSLLVMLAPVTIWLVANGVPQNVDSQTGDDTTVVAWDNCITGRRSWDRLWALVDTADLCGWAIVFGASHA